MDDNINPQHCKLLVGAMADGTVTVDMNNPDRRLVFSIEQAQSFARSILRQSENIEQYLEAKAALEGENTESRVVATLAETANKGPKEQ